MAASEHPIEEHLALYMDGLLSPVDRDRIHRHLITCRVCQEEVAATRALRDLDADGLMPPIDEQALARLRDEFRRRWRDRLRAFWEGARQQLVATGQTSQLGLAGLAMGCIGCSATVANAMVSQLGPAAVPGGNSQAAVSDDPRHLLHSFPSFEAFAASCDLHFASPYTVAETHTGLSSDAEMAETFSAEGARSVVPEPSMVSDAHESTHPNEGVVPVVDGSPDTLPIQEPDHQIGTQTHFDSPYQVYPDTCAIRSQQIVYHEMTGQDIPQEQLMNEAQERGWYSPGDGTLPEDAGKLLELHQVPVNVYEGGNVFDLTKELAQGHKVIMGVNSEDLWHQHPLLHGITEALGLARADHAVVVSGIDASDADNVKVIITDPGTGETAAAYPLETFLEACQHSNFHMVATQDPAPPWHPEMSQFDYGEGHLPQIGGLPYESMDDFMQHTSGSPDASAMDNFISQIIGGDAVSVLGEDHGATDAAGVFDTGPGASSGELLDHGLGEPQEDAWPVDDASTHHELDYGLADGLHGDPGHLDAPDAFDGRP